LSVIKQLQNDGLSVVAIEQDERSIELRKFKVPEKVAYIFGSETAGLAKDILGVVDEVVEIPMLGQKESLNVSVTAGIVLYHK
jgi:tRNA G18 (ribose-2'-O)-methylase SpoU